MTILFLLAPFSIAQETNIPAKINRQAIVNFDYDPDGGSIVLQVVDAVGTKKLSVDKLEVKAIGDEGENGRTIPANLARVSASSFKGEMALNEGQWNVAVKLEVGDQKLEGSYFLNVSKSSTSGVIPMVPPNPEVGRMGQLVGLMIGIPMVLALLAFFVGIIAKNRAQARAEAL
jgi:nitrogen fixation protein FixH